MGFMMAQEVFSSLIRATAVGLVALERHVYMSLRGAPRSCSHMYREGSIPSSMSKYQLNYVGLMMWAGASTTI